MKLKIYTDLSLVPLGRPVELLFPFVGTTNPEFKEGRLKANTFKEYYKNAEQYFEFTSIEDCDICLLPIQYQTSDQNANFEEAIASFVNLTLEKEKRILIFLDTFIENYPVNIKNAIIFDRAISKSKQRHNAYSYPIFFEDYLKYFNNDQFEIADKKSIPIVGFCGYAPPLGIKFGKQKIISSLKLIANYIGIIKFFPSKSSHSYRARILLSLKRSKKITSNFRIKQQFAFGPSGQLNTGNTKETDYEFRSNFVRNILESDYTLSVRGLRNTSIRFFETICCGKVPLFINTDCVLPFDFMIDWKVLCIWVEENDMGKVADIVGDFHKNIPQNDFIELQKKMRFLWKEYLSADGFFKNLRLFLEHQDKVSTSQK